MPQESISAPLDPQPMSNTPVFHSLPNGASHSASHAAPHRYPMSITGVPHSTEDVDSSPDSTSVSSVVDTTDVAPRHARNTKAQRQSARTSFPYKKSASVQHTEPHALHRPKGVLHSAKRSALSPSPSKSLPIGAPMSSKAKLSLRKPISDLVLSVETSTAASRFGHTSTSLRSHQTSLITSVPASMLTTALGSTQIVPYSARVTAVCQTSADSLSLVPADVISPVLLQIQLLSK